MQLKDVREAYQRGPIFLSPGTHADPPMELENDGGACQSSPESASDDENVTA